MTYGNLLRSEHNQNRTIEYIDINFHRIKKKDVHCCLYKWMIRKFWGHHILGYRYPVTRFMWRQHGAHLGPTDNIISLPMLGITGATARKMDFLSLCQDILFVPLNTYQAIRFQSGQTSFFFMVSLNALLFINSLWHMHLVPGII